VKRKEYGKGGEIAEEATGGKKVTRNEKKDSEPKTMFD